MIYLKIALILSLIFPTNVWSFGVGTVGVLGTVESSATGNLDEFTGTSVALTTHDSNWTASSLGIGGMVIDGSGYANPTTAWESRSMYYDGSTTDYSEIVVSDTITSASILIGPCVRMSSTSNGYCLQVHDNDGTDWGDVRVIKDTGDAMCYSSGTYSASSELTMVISASGTSTTVITATINGTAIDSCTVGSLTDSSTPIESGYSGWIYQGAIADTSEGKITSWQDYD